MFLVTGITGQIGGATAKALLARGKQVRALVRDVSRARSWADRGVDLRTGDLTDTLALAAALDGVEGAFLMQPTPIGVTRAFPEARAFTDALVTALDRTPPPRAVVLSSVGSEQSSGLGNITQTHILEQALERFIFPLAVVRPGSLMENNLHSLDRAGDTGVFDSFLQPVDRAFPMTATVDVGAEAARLLVEDWTGHKVVEVGSYWTPAQIADAMAKTLGRPVAAKAIPREYWNSVLGQMGLSGDRAANWEEMQDGFVSGRIDFGRPGAQAVAGTTTPAEVFGQARKAKD